MKSVCKRTDSVGFTPPPAATPIATKCGKFPFFPNLTISPGPPPSLRRQIGIKCRFRNSLTISPGPPPSLRPSLPYGKYYLSHDGTIGDFQGAHNLTRSSTIIATAVLLRTHEKPSHMMVCERPVQSCVPARPVPTGTRCRHPVR